MSNFSHQMNTLLDVRALVSPNAGVSVSFGQHLEVSLDCAVCGRTHRTVAFGLPDQPGRCTLTGHEFPGFIGAANVSKSSRQEVELHLELSYEYSPVVDSKYPNRRSMQVPTWGRVHFSVHCPQCSRTTERAIQNNTGRPWRCVCECGYELYREVVAYPTFSLRGTGG